MKNVSGKEFDNMKTLLDLIRQELTKVLTENGDTAFRTTMNANLDFFASCGALRRSQEEVRLKTADAVREDEETAILNILHLRDVRGGLGERDSFRTAFRELYLQCPDHALDLLPAIPEYGRWDDVLVLIDDPAATALIAGQLQKDLEAMKAGRPVSLCAKWMPSANTSSARTRELAVKLYTAMGISEQEYRKTLSALRGYIDILERRLSAKDYSFDYEKLPAKALMKHVRAFRRNDPARYEAYLAALAEGKAVSRTRAVFPHEILLLEDEGLREAMWRDLERHPGDAKTIVVRDGSGSMGWLGFGAYRSTRVLPIHVSTAMAILFAEQLTGPFKDKFITFSSRPELVDLSGCRTLAEKIKVCGRYCDCTNTDIMAVYELLLRAEMNCAPEDRVERVVIISDMQFDEGTKNVPTYEQAKKMFAAAGIPLPQIVFWNVNSRADFPATDLKNVRLVAGLSQSIIEGILKDETMDAVQFMMKELAKYRPALKLLRS